MSSEENKKESTKYINRALENVEEDRAKANLMFTSLADYILKGDSERHERFGPVIAKYMEALVKSNDQLIKLTNVVVKSEISEDEDDDNMEDLEDLIEETQLKEGDE